MSSPTLEAAPNHKPDKKVSQPLVWNTSWLAILLLAAAYLFSVVHVTRVTLDSGNSDEQKVLRLIHWQLEPGYREGLQWAIDQYNELPHVKKAGLRVEQQGVTEKVYGQFVNIHLISGTAPDILVNGRTRLIKENAVARFFTPVSDFIAEPNPYNREELLPKHLSPQLKEYLATSSWKDTFTDGMKGGYNEHLNDYFGVPISTYGLLRLFYNMSIVAEAKQFVRRSLETAPRPSWLTTVLGQNGQTDALLPETPVLLDWLKGETPPETFGQMLLLCEAARELAKQQGHDLLVPISGSGYASNDLGYATYLDLFLSGYGPELDVDNSNSVSGLEVVHAWEQAAWSFDDKRLREATRMLKLFARYYPAGYLGLDREQAQRRFVQGNAMILPTGGWDANSIFSAVDALSDRSRFNIQVTRAPISAKGEIWDGYLADRRSEAEFSTGVPLAINKQSPLHDEALDFLRFLTSVRINEEMNRRTGWLPVVVGGQPLESMRPFLPDPEGIPPGLTLPLRATSLISPIRNAADSNLKLLIIGDIDYNEYTRLFERALNEQRLGAKRQWIEFWQKKNDQAAAVDQGLNVESIRQYLLNDPTAEPRRRSVLFQAVTYDRGYLIQALWRDSHDQQDFPKP